MAGVTSTSPAATARQAPRVPHDVPNRRPPHDAPRWALWRLAFRPFYLLASLFAALSTGLWALQLAGLLERPYLSGPLWHAHEMLFGFALAVVVGFLFTAGRVWSGQATPTGLGLAALAVWWIAARVLVLTPFAWAAAIVDASFAFGAAAALAVPFWRARNRRNYFFVALLLLLGMANLAFHLTQLAVLPWPPMAGIRGALDVLLFVIAVIGGRVIPMFTNNGVAGAGATKQRSVEALALGLTLALLAADVAQAPGSVLAVVAAAAAVAHAVRWALWRPWKTPGAPLVWVLHAAYAWIPVHLVLRAAAALGGVPDSAATHALTVGAIGGMIVGMMTRTSRGHLGLPLQADRWDVACYALVLVAAVVRVLLPLAMPAWSVHAVMCSAALWCAGFALFAVRHGPALCRPRRDGQPG